MNLPCNQHLTSPCSKWPTFFMRALACSIAFGISPIVAQTHSRLPVAVLSSPAPKGVQLEAGLAKSVLVQPRERVLLFSGDRVMGMISAERDLTPLLQGIDAQRISFERIPGESGVIVRFSLPSDQATAIKLCQALYAGLNKVNPTLSAAKSRGRILLSTESINPILTNTGWPIGEATLLNTETVVLSWPSPIGRVILYSHDGTDWKPYGNPIAAKDGAMLLPVLVRDLGLREGQVIAWLPETATHSDLGVYRLRLATATECKTIANVLPALNINTVKPTGGLAGLMYMLSQLDESTINLRWLALQTAVASDPADVLAQTWIMTLLQEGEWLAPSSR